MHDNDIKIKEIGIQVVSAHSQRTLSPLHQNGKHRINRNIAKYKM